MKQAIPLMKILLIVSIAYLILAIKDIVMRNVPGLGWGDAIRASIMIIFTAFWIKYRSQEEKLRQAKLNEQLSEGSVINIENHKGGQ